MKSSIVRSMRTISALVIAFALTASACSYYVLSELKIGGPAYQRIIAGKDFVADILPPPLYLVEAYLAIKTSNADVVALKAQLAPMQKSFEEKEAAWQASPSLPESLRNFISSRAAPEGRAFWRVVNDLYLPALEKGDQPAIAAAGAQLEKAYQKHRETVLAQVEAANQFLTETEESAASMARWLTNLGLAVVAAALLVLIGALAFVLIRLVRPIVNLSRFVCEVAAGQEKGDPPYRERKDEIGEMSGSIAVLKAVAEDQRRAEAEAAEQKAKVAAQLKDREQGAKWYIENRDFFFKEYTAAMSGLSKGDLVVRLDKPFIKDYEELRHTFNAAIERLHTAMAAVVSTSDTITASSEEISSAIEDLSRRNETQAATLTETASSVDQFTQKVRSTAEGAANAREIVHAARGDAKSGEKVVGEVISAMEGISGSSEKITQIIGIIDEIAFQTNLLALNAGVEAARAGEAGRGFAVVATEVRSLAQRSTEAAKEIKGLISEANTKVSAGNSLAANSGEALRRIVDQVETVLSIVDEIAASAESQANVLREINSAVQEIDRMTQQNAAMAEEVNATSRSLAGNSAGLKSLTDQFIISYESRDTTKPARAQATRQAAAVVQKRGGGALRQAKTETEDWEEF